MTETYYLTRLADGWAKFEPKHPRNWTADRHIYIKADRWEELKRPIELLVAVENLEPFKDSHPYGKDS